ncbi:hypothetical protein [Lactobacillus sp. PSON]|uniref:hypothetical protein n=1 Tax=Lactobacillus sp. PSON TaxID=3455454 RepID=UPI0040431BFA
MTEKRSDYRKKQRQSRASIFDRIKSAFIDDPDSDFNLNDNANKKEESATPKRRSLEGNGKADEPTTNFTFDKKQIQNEKGLKLKKRLNQTIVVLIVLIILVLLALFHL